MLFWHTVKHFKSFRHFSVDEQLLDNASVDREYLEMKIPFSNISGLMWINISISPKLLHLEIK